MWKCVCVCVCVCLCVCVGGWGAFSVEVCVCMEVCVCVIMGGVFVCRYVVFQITQPCRLQISFK